MQNSTSTLKDSLAVSYKATHNLTIWYIDRAPKCLPNSNENLCLRNNLNVSVYSSFIHNFPKLEATKISFNRQIYKQTVVHPYNGISFTDKKMSYQAVKTHGGNLNAYYLVKEASLEGYILHDSNYMTLWKRQNYRHSRKVSSCQRFRGRKRWIKRQKHMVVF